MRFLDKSGRAESGDTGDDSIRALVVFSAEPVGHLTHCFTYLDDGNYWIKIDGAYGKISAEVVGASSQDLAPIIRSQGFPCIEVNGGCTRIYAPVQPFSCVSMVKRTIGIRAPFIVTAKQLYHYLESNNGQLIQSAETPVPSPTSATTSDA